MPNRKFLRLTQNRAKIIWRQHELIEKHEWIRINRESRAFILAYSLLLGFLFFQNRRSIYADLRDVKPAVILFTISYFTIYLILYIWYMSIASGNRFILGLFLPSMIVILYLLKYARSKKFSFNILGATCSSDLISPIILLYFVVYMLIEFSFRIMYFDGGG